MKFIAAALFASIVLAAPAPNDIAAEHTHTGLRTVTREHHPTATGTKAAAHHQETRTHTAEHRQPTGTATLHHAHKEGHHAGTKTKTHTAEHHRPTGTHTGPAGAGVTLVSLPAGTNRTGHEPHPEPLTAAVAARDGNQIRADIESLILIPTSMLDLHVGIPKPTGAAVHHIGVPEDGGSAHPSGAGAHSAKDHPKPAYTGTYAWKAKHTETAFRTVTQKHRETKTKTADAVIQTPAAIAAPSLV